MLSEEQERRDAVRRVLGGEPVAVVAASMGRSEPWVRKWVNRYDPADETWARSRSRAPKTVKRTDAEIEALVVTIRQRLARNRWAQVGASTIAWELEKLGIENRPGLRTIEHILVRHQVPRRSRQGSYIPKGTRYPTGASEVPNACQQGDLVGPRYVEDKSVFYAVNVIDVARRKPAGVITLARSADAISEALVDIWNRLGVPARLQLDNQQALGGARGRPGKVARLCLTHGVTPSFIPFAEPWRNGVVERFNDTFDKKFYRTERFATIDHVTERYQQFLDFHNATHRYSALGGATPDQAETRTGFTPQPPDPTIEVPDSFHDLTGHIEWIRLIRSDQLLHILNRTYPMPDHLRYQYVTATLNVEHRQLIVTHYGNEITRHPFPLT